MSLTIILVVVLLVLVGCDGYRRLLGDSPKEEPKVVQQQAQPQERVLTGFLHKQNFVEVEGAVDYVEFQTEHGTSYKEIPPYDAELDKQKKPFYIVSGKSLIFFNVVSGSYRIYLKP